MSTFSPSQFLHERNAVLVHFSTVMSRHPELLFPNDLINAIQLRDTPLSFSTIMPGDTNPHVDGRGGAEGSIGLLAALSDDTIIHSVSSGDSGSGPSGSLGLLPTREACEKSIEERITSNEWYVSNYYPVGIFILFPIKVQQRFFLEESSQHILGECEISFSQALQHFRGHRIFSANDQNYLEFDRNSCSWGLIQYDDMGLL